MLTIQLITLIIFVLTYISIILLYTKKSIIAWTSVFIILILNILSPKQALFSINLNVLFLYVGMLFISELFLYSKMPDFLAEIFTSKAKRAWSAMLILCAMSGILSIFLENVAVVLLMAPIALSVSKRCKISPVNLFIGIAISSNLQGVATLIGDPPSMLLAGFANMSFNDFFFIDGKLGIFFAVQLAFIASLFVLYFFFRKENKLMPKVKKEKYVTIVPSLLVLILVISLIVSSFFESSIYFLSGLICLIFGIIGILWYYFFNEREESIKDFIFKLDWDTALFLMGIFVLVESVSANGLLTYVSDFILHVGGDSVFLVFVIIVSVSVLVSAFVDNVPFLIAMLPVVKIITDTIGANKYLFYFGLLIGASVGGNITPVGASANIVAMGIVKKKGYNVKFMQFVKIGLIFTLVSVLVASIFLWLVYN